MVTLAQLRKTCARYATSLVAARNGWYQLAVKHRNSGKQTSKARSFAEFLHNSRYIQITRFGYRLASWFYGHYVDMRYMFNSNDKLVSALPPLIPVRSEKPNFVPLNKYLHTKYTITKRVRFDLTEQAKIRFSAP